MAVRSIIPGFQSARHRWVEAQRDVADEFNIFRVMGVESAEVMHSLLLRWLLSPAIENGTHAQGNLGLRLFLEEFSRDLARRDGADKRRYADCNYWVDCEVSGRESRVDIEIAARNSFLIHIENKIYSSEGDDQTNREWRDLEERRKQLGVPESCSHASFLTLDGSPATNVSFLSIGWSRVARVLERFAEEARPPEVKLFVRHYAKAMRTLSVQLQCESEPDNAHI